MSGDKPMTGRPDLSTELRAEMRNRLDVSQSFTPGEQKRHAINRCTRGDEMTRNLRPTGLA